MSKHHQTDSQLGSHPTMSTALMRLRVDNSSWRREGHPRQLSGSVSLAVDATRGRLLRPELSGLALAVGPTQASMSL